LITDWFGQKLLLENNMYNSLKRSMLMQELISHCMAHCEAHWVMVFFRKTLYNGKLLKSHKT